MRKIIFTIVIISLFMIMGCFNSADRVDRVAVEEQQEHFQKVYPVPHYDYSIPRDVLIQIYDVVTTQAYTTYTVIESITGETKFHGPSVGYGIPVDTQLTNPLRPAYSSGSSGIIEQAEPAGVFSSKNTDGTWVLFINPDGNVVPIYTEHKVTTFPFIVEKAESGEWVRVGRGDSEFTIDINY